MVQEGQRLDDEVEQAKQKHLQELTQQQEKRQQLMDRLSSESLSEAEKHKLLEEMH